MALQSHYLETLKSQFSAMV